MTHNEMQQQILAAQHERLMVRRSLWRHSNMEQRRELVRELFDVNPGIVFSRKDICDHFGVVSKNGFDRPLTDLIAEGFVVEDRYERPPHGKQWFYGYRKAW